MACRLFGAEAITWTYGDLLVHVWKKYSEISIQSGENNAHENALNPQNGRHFVQASLC